MACYLVGIVSPLLALSTFWFHKKFTSPNLFAHELRIPHS